MRRDRDGIVHGHNFEIRYVYTLGDPPTFIHISRKYHRRERIRAPRPRAQII